MFNTITNTAIDTIQAGKKQIVNTVVKHEGLAESINKFVDAETAYTKAFIENISGLASNFQTVFTSKEFAKEVAATFTPSSSKKAK
jgi:deoxyadenosine/deoxycytidine kinase